MPTNSRDIRATISVDGEAKFKSELNSARSALRVMQAELKAETAAMGKNASEVKKAQAQAASYRQQIDQQKKVVAALTKAVEESIKQNGENSKATDKYRTSLANARRELASMESALDAVNAKGGSFGATMKNALATGLPAAGNAAGKALLGLGATAGTVFAGIVASAKSAIGAIGALESETAAKADDLLTKSQTTGVSVADLQAWGVAGELYDTSVDTITDSIKKLRKSMTTKENAADLGTLLGINVKDKNGMYRDAQELFFDIAQAISEGRNGFDPTSTEGGNFLQSLFGKGYDDLQPLLQNYEAWQKAAQDAKDNGLIMDDETVAKFGELDDTLRMLEATITAIKESMAGLFLEGWSTLATDVTNVATAFNLLLKGEGDEAAVGAALTQLLTDIAQAAKDAWTGLNAMITGLQESDDENIQSIGNALAAVRDAVVGIWEHRDDIIKAIEGLIGLWAAGKITTAIDNAAKFARNVNSAFSALKKLGGAEAKAGMDVLTGGTGGGTPTPTSTPTSTGGGSIWGALGSAGLVSAIVGGSSAVFAGIAGFIDSENKRQEGQRQILRDYQTDTNAGRWVAEDPAAAAAAVQAYADAYAAQGAWMSGAMQGQMMEDIANQFGGDFDIAGQIMDAIAAGTTVGGENGAWQIPTEWFSEVETGTGNAIQEGVEAAAGEMPGQLQGELSGVTLHVAVIGDYAGTNGVPSSIGTGYGPRLSNPFGEKHATGLLRVPYDGYPAILHKDESILPRIEAQRYRASGTSGSNDQRLVALMVNTVASALGNVQVNMGAESVGTLVAPTVSEMIARQIAMA